MPSYFSEFHWDEYNGLYSSADSDSTFDQSESISHSDSDSRSGSDSSSDSENEQHVTWSSNADVNRVGKIDKKKCFYC